MGIPLAYYKFAPIAGSGRQAVGSAVMVTQLATPPHIDPARVVDFDFFADRRYAEAGHPFSGLIRLCEDVGHGMFWTPHNGGHWFVTDHELLFELTRDPGLFSNENTSFPPLPPEDEPWYPPLNVDAPRHIKYRMPLMRALSPTRIRELQEDIRALAIELIETIAGKGRCDFLDAVAAPLPLTIFMKLMGFDLSRYREFREWALAMTGADDDLKRDAYVNTIAMARELCAARRIERRDDLVSHLLDERIDGEPFSQFDLDGLCLVLFGAGLDTVVNSLSFSMEHLARDPALQDRLRASPDLIPEAVEELLRRYSVAFSMRTIKRDGSFHGMTLKPGERVLLMLAAANLDPKAFPEPERFDLDRENKTHVAFNTGAHRCVGSHLSRVEMATLIEEWLKRMPNVRLDPANPPTYRTNVVFEITSLPLLWDTAARRV